VSRTCIRQQCYGPGPLCNGATGERGVPKGMKDSDRASLHHYIVPGGASGALGPVLRAAEWLEGINRKVSSVLVDVAQVAERGSPVRMENLFEVPVTPVGAVPTLDTVTQAEGRLLAAAVASAVRTVRGHDARPLLRLLLLSAVSRQQLAAATTAALADAVDAAHHAALLRACAEIGAYFNTLSSGRRTAQDARMFLPLYAFLAGRAGGIIGSLDKAVLQLLPGAAGQGLGPDAAVWHALDRDKGLLDRLQLRAPKAPAAVAATVEEPEPFHPSSIFACSVCFHIFCRQDGTRQSDELHEHVRVTKHAGTHCTVASKEWREHWGRLVRGLTPDQADAFSAAVHGGASTLILGTAGAVSS